jgi:hypothetical protein
MKFLVGILVGVFYAVLVTLALGQSSQGWQAGNADLGFWWAVIGTLLGIAGAGAVIGSWLHTRPSED